MKRVIVTVKRSEETTYRDLEVPAEVKVGQLCELIAKALQWENDSDGQSVGYEIRAEPLGRRLHSDESLADAGVWDGAWLIFQPIGGIGQQNADLKPPKEQASTTKLSFLGGFRDLGIPIPPSTAQEQDSQNDDAEPPAKFVWKRLD